MSRSQGMVLALGLAAMVLTASLPAAVPNSPAPGIELTGAINGPDGKPMEGIAVSAKMEGSSITTSVWTNERGAYAFPVLDSGRYQVWAQAVGFERSASPVTITQGKAGQQNFTMKPLAAVLPRQLSTAEWLMRLPDTTSQDRRMKMVVLNQCSNCHLPANWLEKKFDADSWETIFDHMLKVAPDGSVPEDGAGDPVGRRSGGIKFPEGEVDVFGEPIGIHTKLMQFYRKDLIEYLTKIAGPTPVALDPTPLPRPKGLETQLVVTEYDLPWERPGGIGKLDPATGKTTFYVDKNGTTVPVDVPIGFRNPYRSGSDWTWGTREGQRGTHDIAIGNDGAAYFAGGSMGIDSTGNTVWMGGGRQFTSFDIKTKTLKVHSKVLYPISHGVDEDKQGNAWGSNGKGAFRMNIKTGEVTEFFTLTPDSRPYDIGIDRLDNVWLSQIAIDKMAVIDSRTGDVKEVAIPPLKSPDIRPEDMKIFNEVGSWDHNSALGQQGPRRMGADRRGDYVYAGLYWSGGLAQFDARTKTLVKVHQIPNGRWGQAYKPYADKHHIVWFGMSADDKLGKLNPTTGKITMYPLPTRGSNSRHLGVDDSTDPPTVWVPYTGAGKVARVQFRTDTTKD